MTEVLTERGHDCVFLRDGVRCEVYEARPIQCRTFPFWPRNLKTPEAWHEAARECEGIGRSEELVQLRTIEQQKARQEHANASV